DEGGLGAPRTLDVAVETVVGHVQLAAHEPLGVRRLPLERLLPRLEPGQLARTLLPEAHRVAGGLAIDRLAPHQRPLRERLRRPELAVFLEECLDRVALRCLRHAWTSPVVECCACGRAPYSRSAAGGDQHGGT